MVKAGGSSHGQGDDQQLVVAIETAPLVLRVPLLSQEGLTCRLLSGATAPCPALDQVLVNLSAPAT